MPGLSWANLVQDADVAEDKVLDPGEYELILKKAVFKQTKAGDPMISCRYAVESGPHKGTTVWDNITILSDPTKKAGLQINMRKLYTLGADIQFLQSEPSNEAIVQRIEGSRVVASVVISNYNSTDRNEIKSFKANKDAAPTARPAETPAPAAAPSPAPASAQTEAPRSPSEEYAETAPAAEEEAPKASTKRRGSIPLPPPA